MIVIIENNLSVLIGKSRDQIKTNSTDYDYKLLDSIPVGIPSEILLDVLSC